MRINKILLSFLFLTGLCSAQQRLPGISAVFDAGLSSAFILLPVNRNSALLAGQTVFQANAGFRFNQQTDYYLSLATPVYPRLVLGMSWFQIGRTTFSTSDSLSLTTDFSVWNATVSLAFKLGDKFRVGQRVSLNWLRDNENRFRHLAPINQPKIIDITEFDGDVQIHPDLLWLPVNWLQVGVVLPALFGYDSHRIINLGQYETFDLHRRIFPESLAEIAVGATLFPNENRQLAFARTGRDAWHLGGLFRHGWLHAALGVDFFQNQKSRWQTAAGGSWRSFALSAAYDFSEKISQLTVSWNPENLPPLFEWELLATELTEFYLYKAGTYQNQVLLRGVMTNLNPSALKVEIITEGAGFLSQRQALKLAPFEQREIAVCTNGLQPNAEPGAQTVSLQINAFFRYVETREEILPVHLVDRHDWNGALADLLWFLQPSHPDILAATEKISNSLPALGSPELPAQKVFEFISQRIRYQTDPTGKQDFVFYPNELLQRGTGDCEDLALLYCSLLGALGMRTALVQVADYSPGVAHIFVLVNLEKSPEQFDWLETNPARIIFRQQSGRLQGWLPVEVTLTSAGFDAAWQKGAEIYDRYVIQQNGLEKEGVQIFEVN